MKYNNGIVGTFHGVIIFFMVDLVVTTIFVKVVWLDLYRVHVLEVNEGFRGLVS